MTAEAETLEQPGWVRGAGGVAYPPEPWSLTGSLLVSAFLVPVERVPAHALDVVPADHAPAVVGGRAVVGAAFAHYAPGGVLQYEELLVALPARRGAAVRNVIPDIWVTSAASQHGGRELWGIPKRLGDFQRTVDGRSVATARGVGHQLRGGARARAPHPLVLAADGPLGWLAGAKPVASFALTDAAILFGARVRRS